MLVRRLALNAAPAYTPTIGVISATVGLAWIAVFLRCYTRIFLVRKFYPEDWVMVIALVFFTGYCTAAIILSDLVTQGTGKMLTLTDALKAVKLILIVESFYIWSVMILKISIGIFFLRITVGKWLRFTAWMCMILSTLMGLALFLFTVLQCGPFDNILIFATKKLAKQCVHSSIVAATSYTHGAITCAKDFAFVVLPILILRKTRMPSREKVTAAGLLMLASASGIAAAVRFIDIDDIAAPTETFFTTCSGITIWSALEAGAGIIAGSIICLRPFARKHMSFIHLPQFSFGRNYYTYGSYGTYATSQTYVHHELSQDISKKRKDSQGQFTGLSSKDDQKSNWYDSRMSSDDPDVELNADMRNAEIRDASIGWPMALPAATVPTNRGSRQQADMDIVPSPTSERYSSNRWSRQGLPLSVYAAEPRSHTRQSGRGYT